MKQKLQLPRYKVETKTTEVPIFQVFIVKLAFLHTAAPKYNMIVSKTKGTHIDRLRRTVLKQKQQVLYYNGVLLIRSLAGATSGHFENKSVL